MFGYTSNFLFLKIEPLLSNIIILIKKAEIYIMFLNPIFKILKIFENEIFLLQFKKF